MEKSINVRKTVFLYFTALFVLAVISYSLYSFITAVITLSDPDGWDGYTVATSFALGNGSKENPYIIQDASEYVYFQQLIEGDNSNSYSNLYYKLGNDINFNGNAIKPIGVVLEEEEKIFTGNLDGAGYSLSNFKINAPVVVDGKDYYSLFVKTKDATIERLIIDNYRIEVEDSDKAIVVSPFVGSNEVTVTEEGVTLSSFTDIILHNFNIDFSKVTTENNSIFAFMGDAKNSKIHNVYLDGEITSNLLNQSLALIGGEIPEVSNFVNRVTLINSTSDLGHLDNPSYYYYGNDSFYHGEDVVAVDSIIRLFNENMPSPYYWDFTDNYFDLCIFEENEESEESETLPVEVKGFSFSIKSAIGTSTSIVTHASGTDGNTFYINDFDMDYNYFKGLNYTEVRTTSLPQSYSGYYDDSNLVKVQLIYDGVDINNTSVVGALSPVSGENAINKFVYYKYYALERSSTGSLLTNSNGDNYIRIELIDNPFSKRPYVNNTEYGFNGWVCNQTDASTGVCDNSTIGFKKSNYTRYMDIPVVGGSEIVVHLNASWVEADVVTSYEDIEDFKTMSMEKMSEVAYYTTENIQGRAYWKQNYTTMVYSRSYVYQDGYMPRGSWYKQNDQSLATYTYISGTRTRCARGNTCYVYTYNSSGIVGGTEYVSGNYSFVPNFNPTGTNTEITIYYYDRNYMNLVQDPNGSFWDTVQVAHYTSDFSVGDSTAGFFYEVRSPTAEMLATNEFYTNTGALCTNVSDCLTAYKLIQTGDSFINSRGNSISIIEEYNGEVVDAAKYYYLVTRDTNIFRYTSTNALSTSDLEVDRPYTITGTSLNGTSPSGVIEYRYTSGWFFGDTYYDFSVQDDLVIENIKINGPNTTGSNNATLGANSKTSQVIYANSHNLKIGRNVTSSDGNNYLTGEAVFGGKNNANVSGTFRIIIESGIFYAYHSGVMSGSSNYTLNETTIFGSDYDRINSNNSKLKFLIGLDGYAGGHNTAGSDSIFASFNIVKSGTFGYNSDGTPNTDNTAGLYIGGRSSQCVESITGAKIEGGNINIVVGGYGYNGSTTTNSTYIGMSGGIVRSIYGGAGHSTTKGNRIINVTGGTVSYSVLGGSDSYDSGDNNDGILQGSTLVYIGGTVTIGGGTGTVQGVESGCVFGAGGGDTTSSQKGTVYNSHVIINGGTINTAVYGGGNYGSTGTQSSSTATTVIDVYSGTIGNIYGGSKSAGFSQSSYSSSSTIDINVHNGTIGNIYGGSDEEGQVFGSVNINVHDGTITSNVYGGGRGNNTFVDANVNVIIGDNVANHPTINGSVYGGSAYGTVNSSIANGSAHGNTSVKINNGVIQGSVFGGAQGSSSYTPHVQGNITLTVDNGSIGKVFGGFDAAGYPNAVDIVFLNGGTIGEAYGGGNNTGQNTTDIRLQGSTITGTLYGGSNLSGTVNTSNVTVTSGSVVDIYGGNNLAGITSITNISATGGDVSGDIYGGGNQAESKTTNVTVNGTINIDNVYGGGNQAGVSNSTHVNIAKGTINGVYGGSNQSGTVRTTNVTVGPDISNFYDDYTSGGSGLEVSFNYRFSSAQYQTDLYPEYQTIVDITPIFRNTTEEDFDEWSVTLNVPDSTFFVHDGDANIIVNGESYIWNQDDRWWGTNPIPAGSTYSPSLPLRVLFKGTENDFRLIYDLEATDGNNGVHKTTNDPNYVSPTQGGGINIGTIYGGNNIGGTVNISNVTLNNGTVGEIYGGGNQVGLTTSNVEITGGNITSVYGGSNRAGDVTTSNVNIGGESTINITDVYGGNNLGGVTTNANVTTSSGVIGTLYGGGNRAVVGSTNVSITNTTATDIYGGGNSAGVNTNTILDINSSTVSNNIYGGGNEGVVEGSTSVFITGSHIQGNAFAGGNGSTAVVYGNSTITIDGNSEVGTASSEAPNGGCVFGSGNAASTGLADTGGSVAKVNIVGGKIHGNVYGGPKMAVVYGTTETNIGTSAVNINGLTEDDIVISGTVFGGGESNASGSTTYDWTFISVTEGISVNIDGTGYENNSHDFIINGSIFGSGNASSSSGSSDIYIKNLGTMAHPNKSISIQRANNLIIDSSVIELSGTTDRTNEYSDIYYSLNIIDYMVLKNDTTLLLHHNANLLKELYSGVDSNNGLVPATVDIDDENHTVTKNVDNRIYMLPGEILNVSINQAATAYGRITGMTFFGMYQSFDNGTYRFGLYDPSVSYGDSGNASQEILGGSYVIGLRNVNHDITKDGFYSNQLDEETFSTIETFYIDPSPIGETGYRWVIGFEAINYEFTLTASKYSSLGTYELQLIDFAGGNTAFTVLGFDSSGLNPDVSLVDSNLVPRIGATQEEANGVLGLSMKAETQEWTGYGVTKLVSEDNGDYTGDRDYRTDSRPVAPSLMFYLYHTKNIDLQANLGTVVLTLQAAIPRNAVEDEIKFITVTINLVARRYNDGDSYDASITYDRKYEMPSSTLVNITNQSQFTAYFSMILSSNSFASVYGRNNDYYHVITSNHVLPLNTMITMLDFGANDSRPEYYYFKVTQAVYNDSVQQLNQYNEVSYRLDQFIKMDSTSTNNTYDDSVANLLYYDEDSNFADEEFIFIFDFKDTTVTGEHLENSILFELRDNEDRTKLGVLGIREELMFYNTYESSNVVLNQTVTDSDSYLYYDIADEFAYSTEIQYNETENRQSVIDTNYESSKMGLNVVFLDNDGEPVSSSLLIGTSIFVGNQEYFADGDGVFRIKLANKVSNLNKAMKIVANKNLPAGQYTVRYILFASDDGLHNSHQENSVTEEFNVTVVSADNSISADCDDLMKVVIGETGLNLAGTRTNVYDIKYESQLTNPNFRIEIYKRKVTSIDTTEYDSIPFNQLFTNTMTTVSGNEVSFTMSSGEESLEFELQNNLTSGTYKIVFKLYDGNQLIDDDIKYVIVKKKLS